MRTEVFQVQARKFDEYGDLLPRHEQEISFVKIGEVVGVVNDVDLVWHLTNHHCWMRYGGGEIKSDGCIYHPTEYDRGYTNDDIYFQFEGEWYCANRIGWSTFSTKEHAEMYLLANSRMRE